MIKYLTGQSDSLWLWWWWWFIQHQDSTRTWKTGELVTADYKEKRLCPCGWVVAVLGLLLSPRAASCPSHLAETSEPFSDCHYQSMRHDLARWTPFASPARGHISWSWKASLKQLPCTGCRNLLTGMPLPQVMYLPQHQIPIQERHHVSLHEVHGKSLFALVKREGLQGLSVVVKLCENHTVVASDQRTRRVAIILWWRQSGKVAFFHVLPRHLGFPGGSGGKESAWQCRRCRFNPWVGKISWRWKWQPTPVLLPGKSMDRGAWLATVHGVAKSQTQLSDQTTTA